MKLIGICGPMGAGKSVAARILRTITRLPVVPFAAPIKTMLASVGVPYANLYGTPTEKADPLDMLCGKSARHAMQTLGTEWRDTIGRDLWLKIWLAKVQQAGAIADDVRFDHEAAAIQARGGIVIKIAGRAAEAAGIQGHASENSDVPYDFAVSNTGSPRKLADELERCLRSRAPWLIYDVALIR